jgi:tetratricopeptide (TPR) repeat protein
MRTRLITQLVQVPQDLDYVGHFQVLNALNLEIRRQGPSAERLLRKAILEMDVGNYPASLAAALDACSMHPASPETHHQVGMSYLLLALSKAGVVPLGPGAQEGAPDSVTGLLWRAIEAFHEALTINPGDDETRAAAKALQEVLADHPTERGLVQAIRHSM